MIGSTRTAMAAGLAAALALWAPARGQAAEWPDGFVTRLEALAVVQTLNADLLASRSATFTLQDWCARHHLAGTGEARIVAHLLRGAAKPPTAEQRRRLGVGPSDEVRYRHVQLACGQRVLSEADNWYVPGRLTAEMNRLLDTTDTPFGKAVADLHPYRQTFAVDILWHPLPDGWETSARPDAAGALVIPDALFEHRAVLYTQDRQPFSEVRETYQRHLLDFTLPRPQTSPHRPR